MALLMSASGSLSRREDLIRFFKALQDMNYRQRGFPKLSLVSSSGVI